MDGTQIEGVCVFLNRQDVIMRFCSFFLDNIMFFFGAVLVDVSFA